METIDTLPKDKNVFTGWINGVDGRTGQRIMMRYQDVERHSEFNDFPYRYKCPDGVWLYLHQKTLTHWTN